jgi:hypothetical protein
VLPAEEFIDRSHDVLVIRFQSPLKPTEVITSSLKINAATLIAPDDLPADARFQLTGTPDFDEPKSLSGGMLNHPNERLQSGWVRMCLPVRVGFSGALFYLENKNQTPISMQSLAEQSPCQNPDFKRETFQDQTSNQISVSISMKKIADLIATKNPSLYQEIFTQEVFTDPPPISMAR